MNSFGEYLFAIAYMQTALSKLLEAQAKIICRLSEEEFSAAQAAEINKSLRNQLKKLEHLHLLLLHRLEPAVNRLADRDFAQKHG